MELDEGILADFSDELLGLIIHTDYSFADYARETASLITPGENGSMEQIQDFLELWTGWYVNQRRLERARTQNIHNPHADTDEEQYCSGNHEDGGCDV
jgi:hypothetical protein